MTPTAQPLITTQKALTLALTRARKMSLSNPLPSSMGLMMQKDCLLSLILLPPRKATAPVLEEAHSLGASVLTPTMKPLE